MFVIMVRLINDISNKRFDCVGVNKVVDILSLIDFDLFAHFILHFLFDVISQLYQKCLFVMRILIK